MRGDIIGARMKKGRVLTLYELIWQIPVTMENSMKKLNPNLMVKDVKETVEFYQNNLGGTAKTRFLPNLIHIFETESQENILPMPIDVGFS